MQNLWLFRHFLNNKNIKQNIKTKGVVIMYSKSVVNSEKSQYSRLKKSLYFLFVVSVVVYSFFYHPEKTYALTKAESCVTTLYANIQMQNGNVQGCLSVNDSEILFQQPLLQNMYQQTSPLEMNDSSGNVVSVASCADFDSALSNSSKYPNARQEYIAQNIFKPACTALKLAQNVTSPIVFLAKNFDLTHTEVLSVGLIPAFAKSERFQILKDAKNRLTINDYYKKGVIKNLEATADEIKFYRNGINYEIKRIAASDFDHDGFEDVLLFVRSYSVNGNYKNYDMALITKRKKNNRILDLVSYDTMCRTLNDGLYICNPSDYTPDGFKFFPDGETKMKDFVNEFSK